MIGLKIMRIQHVPSEDYLDDLGVRLNGLPRISANQQQVGALADLHSADFPAEAKCFRIRQGRGTENLGRSDSGLHQSIHLQPAI